MRFSLMPFWDKVNSGFFHIHIYIYARLDEMTPLQSLSKKISNLGSSTTTGKSLTNEDRYYEIPCVLQKSFVRHV